MLVTKKPTFLDVSNKSKMHFDGVNFTNVRNMYDLNEEKYDTYGGCKMFKKCV